MGRILDDRYAEDVKDEVMAIGEDMTSEELIPGLVLAIRILSLQFPDPERVLDEVVMLLEEGPEEEE